MDINKDMLNVDVYWLIMLKYDQYITVIDHSSGSHYGFY